MSNSGVCVPSNITVLLVSTTYYSTYYTTYSTTYNVQRTTYNGGVVA